MNWCEQANIVPENTDPFKLWIEGTKGIVTRFDKTAIGVTLTKNSLNMSGLIGNGLQIKMNKKRGGFEIFENNLEKPNFMSYEIFSSRIIFRKDMFFVEIG